MATLELIKENFNATVESGKTVVIDFWAPWCGPCRSFAPTFETVSEEFPDVVFGKINTEVEQELGAAFNIRSIPTLRVFREQIILFTTNHQATREAIISYIKKTGLSELMNPRQIKHVDSIALLASGKVDYVTLQQLVFD